MPDGLISIINTKLLRASTCAEQIKRNASEHRAGASTYENANTIVKILDEVMKDDLHNLRKEFEE